MTRTMDPPDRSSAGVRLRRVLRLSSGLGLLAVLMDGALLATGVIDWRTALLLLLVVEAPLMVVALVLHCVVYRNARRSGADRAGVWEALLAANPPLRLIQVELGHVVGLPRDLWTLARGDHRGPGLFGSAAGTLAMPICLTVLLVLETLVVHLLIPWPWLRLVLLVLNLYAVLLVCSSLAGRVANPHELVDGVLRLRFGRHTVAEVPATALTGTACTRRDHTWFGVSDPEEGSRALHLANQFGTTVRLVPERPLPVRVPHSLGPDQRHLVDEVHLMVDDPEEFLAALETGARAR